MALFDFGSAGLRAVRQACIAATPEVLEASQGGGVWETTQVMRTGFEDIPLPRWHVQYPPAEPWGSAPMTQIIYEQPVIAYYLAFSDGGPSALYRSKAQALQNQITKHGLRDDGEGGTGAEFTWVPTSFRIHCYDADEMNAILLLRNNYAQAGAFAFAFLVGDTEH